MHEVCSVKCWPVKFSRNTNHEKKTSIALYGNMCHTTALTWRKSFHIVVFFAQHYFHT